MTHIGAVTLVVPDYDAAIDFYVNKAGFQLIDDTRLSPTKRWVLIGTSDTGTNILLAKPADPKQSAAIGNQTGGRVSFFLHTCDFQRDYEAMKAKGVTFEEGPRSEPYGTVAVWCDPWGNRWDLLQLT